MGISANAADAATPPNEVSVRDRVAPSLQHELPATTGCKKGTLTVQALLCAGALHPLFSAIKLMQRLCHCKVGVVTKRMVQIKTKLNVTKRGKLQLMKAGCHAWLQLRSPPYYQLADILLWACLDA